jgi:hypothetical protein
MQKQVRRRAGSTEVPVERRVSHIPNAFTGAVAVMCDPREAKSEAERALAVATHGEAHAIRCFLTSAYGAAFGVDVAQRVAAGEPMGRAIRATIREWMTRAPSSAEAAALGIRSGVPFLSAVVAAAGLAQRP